VHDYMDVGGRVVSGTTTEEALMPRGHDVQERSVPLIAHFSYRCALFIQQDELN